MDATLQKIFSIIDAHHAEIIAFGDDIYNHAELGYKEFRTTAAFQERMQALGLPVQAGLAITGARACLNPEKRAQGSLALIAELDALRIPAHVHANPETQAAHCCGHHAQLAGLVGAAIALTDPEIRAVLDGQVVFFAVPAEEYGELEFKKDLIEAGRIAYGGGKCELLRIGAFDDIDMSVVHHLAPNTDISLGSGSSNGFVSKVITFQGRAAHAAAAPERGVNALSAASLGLQALALNRETFRDADCVRVHPILTRGGDLVNVVPETAVVETLVRGRTLEAIQDAARKTDRSFQAGALAMGAGLRIETMPGYLPQLASVTPDEIVQAVQACFGASRVQQEDPAGHSGGSSDVGDLKHLQPVLSFRTGGMSGILHGTDFDIVDAEKAYIDTAKLFALHAYLLLKDNAHLLHQVKQAYSPRFASIDDYTACMDRFTSLQEMPLQN